MSRAQSSTLQVRLVPLGLVERVPVQGAWWQHAAFDLVPSRPAHASALLQRAFDHPYHHGCWGS